MVCVKRISHSAWKKYTTCPKLYDLHYNERLRPVGKSSALYFGVAIDEALNALLLEQANPVDVFREHFDFDNMGDCVWDNRDFDASLFDKDELVVLNKKSSDYRNWACLRVKGRLLLEAYREQILPQIQEVHSVQQELPERPGFVDAILTLKGYGKVLIDHKTSASPYDKDAIGRDTQLALYSHALGIKRIGFVVLNKRLIKDTKKICTSCGFDGSATRHKTCNAEVRSKRCHGTWDETIVQRPYIQLIVQDAPVINQILITKSIRDVEVGIKAGTFPSNLNACNKMYGKPCPYYGKCWANNIEGLEYKE